MDWINLMWLGLGFGFGIATVQLKRRPRRTLPPIAPEAIAPKLNVQAKFSPDDPSHDGHQPVLPGVQEQIRQLELAYQMATEMSQFKGGFLARTSHELRSPLNGLIGMHQLILSDLCDDPAEEREFIAQANNSAQKMVRILDELLNVARIQHGTTQMSIQPIQLTQLLESVRELTYLQALDRNVQLQFQPNDPEIYILADVLRLRQILVHLIDSAIQRLPEAPITIAVHPAPETNSVLIQIDDHCPVSARSESIYQLQAELPTHENIPSPGLTLMIDQILLQLMNSRLEVVAVDAAPPDGDELTRIQCTLPLAQSDEMDC